MSGNGYAGKILTVDLTTGATGELSTAGYAGRFIGGRGIAARIYWDLVRPETRALDPESCLIYMTGPLAGFPGLAGSRWQVCAKSPDTTPQQFSYSNLGGIWGAALKSAGYDGLVITGRAAHPVYLLVNDGGAQVRDAQHVWGHGAIRSREMLKSALSASARVLTIGPAGERMVSYATMLADNDASGSSGFGAVMGSKLLKAIVVQGTNRPSAADPERLRQLVAEIASMKKGNNMAASYNPLPLPGKKELCFGCIQGCVRASAESRDGVRGKFMCGAANFYMRWARAFYGEWNQVPFLATKLCDDHGVDTNALAPMLTWLMKCRDSGILTDTSTGLPLGKMGSLEFIRALIEMIASRQGFGEVLAGGLARAAAALGPKAEAMLDGYLAYGPQVYITTGLFYCVEPRRPIQQLHEIDKTVGRWLDWNSGVPGAFVSGDVIRAVAKRFWGSELAADFSTYDGKALCAVKVQDRAYAKESLVLCDFSWPITTLEHTPDHVGDPSIESKVLSAVTGQEIDEAGLYQAGERVFNLQRAILAREGHRGRPFDVLPDFCYTKPPGPQFFNQEVLLPGESGKPLSRKNAVVDREQFARILDEYYHLRGWDVKTGLQTAAGLCRLGLEDIVTGLSSRDLLAPDSP